ncbi:amino-acid N-acetyltransferase [soil metagenome]
MGGLLSDLRGILHYVPQFRGRVFVVSLDGAVVASPNFANILLDLAVLHSLNIRVVVVHGAGAQVERLAAERGVEVSDSEGIGVTDWATLQVSIDAVTRLTNDIMQNLTTQGLQVATTNAVHARAAGVIGGVDLQHTGRIEKVVAESLEALLDRGMVPLVAPLGFDGKGNTLRLNSDACAAEVAIALKAAKILYLSRDRFGGTARQLTVEDAEALVNGGDVVSEGFRSKLRYGARACREGVSRAHIIDGALNDGLLAELFDTEGVATMVYVDTYQRVRAAEPSDVTEILSLIQNSVRDDELVRRTRRDVVAKLEDYLVLEVDGAVVGTAAVHPYDDEAIAELACLYIRPTHEGRGYGRILVERAEARARDLGAEKLVALSTQAFDFFETKAGFTLGSRDDLPAARREKLDKSGRNSRVMVKKL